MKNRIIGIILCIVLLITGLAATILVRQEPPRVHQHRSAVQKPECTDHGKDVLADEGFLPYFARNDWYGGFSAYLDGCESFLRQNAQGTPFDIDTDPDYGRMPTGTKVAIIVIVPAIIAFIACSIMKGKMKSVALKTNANEYIARQGVALTDSSDIYTHTTQTRIRIEEPSRSSGHGGTSIGSGGFFGKGLGQSLQKLGFVPEAQNDMIFSIICEELGLFGAVCLIMMFMFMIYRFVVIAENAPDLFGSMLVVGIMAHIAIQVILNIAVVTNVIPNTGVTLPFISYGGTSVMLLMVEMGIALSVSNQIRQEEKNV